MHPTLKLIGWTVAPLVLSLPIAIVMGDQNGRAIAQETISEKKAEGDRSEIRNESSDHVRHSINPKTKAQQLLQQGAQQIETSQYPAAIQSFQQALSLYQQLNDSEGKAHSLTSLGIAYWSISKYDQAIQFYNQALSIYQTIQNHIGEASVLTNLGNAYSSLSKYRQAVSFYEKAVRIFKETGNRNGLAMSLNNLGVQYASLGDYKKAIEAYERAFSLFNETMDSHSGSGKADTLTNLGNAYRFLAQYEKAISFYEKALPIYEKFKNRNRQAHVLMNSGLSYLSLAESGKIRNVVQHQKALVSFAEALSIYKSVGDRYGQANLLMALGDSHSSLLMDYSDQVAASAATIAEDYYIEAASIFQEIGYSQGGGMALRNLGRTLLLSGKTKVAERVLFDAISVWESLRAELFDKEKVSLFETQISTYHLLQRALVAQNKLGIALETSDRGRARAFIELLAARFAGETLKNAIAKQKVEKLSIPQIQQVAKAQNATLVQYSIVSNTDLYIYIVQPNGSISFRKAAMSALGKSLNDFVNASRNNLGVRDRGEIVVSLTPEKQQELQEQRDRSLRKLHQLLIEPIADLLPTNENDRVIFMPQGELFLVPFPALLSAQNQPLITQHTILTAPSIQTLDLTHKTAQSLPKGNRPALVVGNPTMPAVTTIIGNPPHKLAPLAGSETEAKAIAKQLNTQAITGDNAKKDAIVQKMQNAGIIHLATHGLLDSFKGDTPGAIALAPNGTNQPNDGLLTSGEIFDLKLNANLVVLSACDTGRGDITGDGVIGLSRSLFVAGVPSVIVSLWKVPDDSTALLMTEFYRNWRERKLDKARALRQAMLSTRDKYPQPLNWAAFTLIGEAE